MLTKRQNLLETIRGGNPDRFVNQFEPFAMVRQTPVTTNNPRPVKGGPNVVNSWGITLQFPENTPGSFPVHDEEHIVIKDITRWQEYVHAPRTDYTAEDWAPYVAAAEQIDRNDRFVTMSVSPGIFEQCHNLMKMENCLISFYEYPDEMHGLIDYIADWELEYARQACDTCGRRYFIPNTIMGGPASTYPGVYDAVTETIDMINREADR